MTTRILTYFFAFIGIFSFAQEETTSPATESFEDKVILYSDFGYNSAPFRLKYPFSGTTNNLLFRNNYSPSIGIGVAHKWFALRLNFNLKGTQRAISRYGNTKAFNLGFNFQIKQLFFDFDLRIYEGYAIKNAYEWDNTLNKLKPNELRPKTSTVSVSLNTYFFDNPEWRMRAYNGQTEHFIRNCHTLYLKPTFSIYSLSNQTDSIVPAILQNPSDTKTSALALSSIEIGLVPGYAIVRRIKNWQVGGFMGIGGVLQAKSYELPDYTRSFLGLAPRTDFRFSVGYTKPKVFVFLVGDFENKSIRFNKLRYKQTYYSLRLSAGYRFTKKEKKKELI